MCVCVCVCVCVLSHIQLFVTHRFQHMRILCPWGFSRPEYWSELPCPPPGDLPNPGIKPRSPTLQADSLLTEPPGKAQGYWSGQPFPSPGYLPDPGIKLGSPALQVNSFPTELSGKYKYVPHATLVIYMQNLNSYDRTVNRCSFYKEKMIIK